jgi:hypothetical protein
MEDHMKCLNAKYLTALPSIFSLSVIVQAEDFSTSVKFSEEAFDANQACDQAYRSAESEALQQIDEFFNEDSDTRLSIHLIQQKETRTTGDAGKTICTFEGTWRAAVDDTLTDLIGTEQAIEGQYNASCNASAYEDHCWMHIVEQARNELLHRLEEDYDNLSAVELRYVDFEGKERERYEKDESTVNADGIFYFKVYEARPENTNSVTVYHQHKPEPESDWDDEYDKDHEEKIDFTLSYTWDHNDRADHNDLAISSDRWGIGIWTKNTIGFSAFIGKDTLGIGDRDDDVHNASGSYQTLGIGIGHRLFDNYLFTVENILYYVDAEPYKATVSPNCSDCNAMEFKSRNYLQATSNLKTNIHGLNIGWMFTWKWLENQSDLNNWSSGFHLELQI